jgi:fucose permease
LCTIGVGILLAAKGLFVAAIGVGVAGLGLSSVFPIAIATLTRRFGASSSRIAGGMFALAGAGGAVLPWLIGYTSTISGSLKYGLIVPLAGSISMLALNVILAWSE